MAIVSAFFAVLYYPEPRHFRSFSQHLCLRIWVCACVCVLAVCLFVRFIITTEMRKAKQNENMIICWLWRGYFLEYKCISFCYWNYKFHCFGILSEWPLYYSTKVYFLNWCVGCYINNKPRSDHSQIFQNSVEFMNLVANLICIASAHLLSLLPTCFNE